jgi:hypothetical protein
MMENIDFEKEKSYNFGYRRNGACGGRGTVKTARLQLFCSEKLNGNNFRTLFDYFFSKK